MKKKNIFDTENNNLYYKKIIEPSKKELELHQRFIKKSLKKNFFN